MKIDLTVLNGHRPTERHQIHRKPDVAIPRVIMMVQLDERVVETPIASTIDTICAGGYWVCDLNRNCREVSGLWEANVNLRERENGFDDPYASNVKPTR